MDILVNENEARALASFIGEKWSEFQRSAKSFLDEQEIEELAEKLEQA